MKPLNNCEKVTGGATSVEYGAIAALITASLIKTLNIPGFTPFKKP